MAKVKYVDICNEKGERLARCILKNGKVQCEGDAATVDSLQKGIIVPLVNGKIVSFFPEDGIAFLEALGAFYDSPYEWATDVKEEEEEAMSP